MFTILLSPVYQFHQRFGLDSIVFILFSPVYYFYYIIGLDSIVFTLFSPVYYFYYIIGLDSIVFTILSPVLPHNLPCVQYSTFLIHIFTLYSTHIWYKSSSESEKLMHNNRSMYSKKPSDYMNLTQVAGSLIKARLIVFLNTFA